MKSQFRLHLYASALTAISSLTPIVAYADISLPAVPDKSNPAIKRQIQELETAARLRFSLKSSSRQGIKGALSPVIADRVSQIDARINAGIQIYSLISKAYPEKILSLSDQDRKMIALIYAGALKPNKILSRIRVKPETAAPDKDGLYLGKAYSATYAEYTIVNNVIPSLFKQALKAIELAKGKYSAMLELSQGIDDSTKRMQSLVLLLSNSIGISQDISDRQKQLLALCDKTEGDLRRLVESVSKPEESFSYSHKSDTIKKRKEQDEQRITYENFDRKWGEYWREYLDLLRVDTDIKKIGERKYQVTAHIHPAKDKYAGTVIVRLASGETAAGAIDPYSGTKFPITGLPKPETDEEAKKRLSVIHYVETHQPTLKIRIPNGAPRYVTLYGIGIDEGPYCDKPRKASWSAENIFRSFWEKADLTRMATPVCYGPKRSVWDEVNGITVTYTVSQNPVGNKKLLPQTEIIFTSKDLRGGV